MTSKGLQRAEEIADEVFFPAAAAVDTGEFDPVSHLDLLAAEGFYGAAAPPDVKSVDIPDFVSFLRVLEPLVGGCLTTSFVWVQHHSAVLAVAGSQRPGIRDRWLEPLCAGRHRAGLAIGAVLRPSAPTSLRATAVDGGYRFDGEAPWLTGWGLVDTVFAAARDASDTAVYALLDAQEGATVAVDPLQMVAVQASRTVRVTFDGHFVPEDRIIGTAPREQWANRDPGTLRGNGSLAVGVAGRCLRLANAGEELFAQLDDCRSTLDNATSPEMPAARAKASEFALRAAATLAVTDGSRSVLMDHHGQRLLREAMFLLVFGSRPELRTELLGLLARPRA